MAGCPGGGRAWGPGRLVIRHPTLSEERLVGQREKASLDSAEWAREIYHGSKNELRPHTVRARARGPETQPRAGEDRTLRSDGRLEGNGRTEARRQRRSRRPRGESYAPATLPLGPGRLDRAVRGPDESSGRTGSRGENLIAPAAPDFRPSQAPQQCSEPVGSFVRPMPVIIGAPGSFEGRTARRAGAILPGLFFRNDRIRGWALPPQRKKGKL